MVALEKNAELVDDREAAKILHLKPQTLRNWRCQHKGPAYVKLGARAIRYDLRDLQNFILSGKIRP